MSALQDAFLKAWQDAQGDDFASRMARKSLHALASENPNLAHLVE